MKMPFFRTAWNYDTNKAGDESGLKCEDETRTQQSFKDETDINNIVRNFGLTGELPQVNAQPLQYQHFDGVMDFQTAMNSVIEAQREFDKLPADVRYRFGNDPQRLVEFVSDEDNRAEAVKLGLVNLPAEVKKAPPMEVVVVDKTTGEVTKGVT